MFIILNFLSVSARKIRRGKTVDRIREIRTGGGERFYILDVLENQKGVNWSEVENFVGAWGRSVLIGEGYSLPQSSSLRKFDCTPFKCLLLYNTASLILRELYLSGCRMRCVVNDTGGKYAVQLEKIVKFSAETTVVTMNSHRYFDECRRLFTEYGAGISVAESCGSIGENDIVIDTDGDYSGGGIVFSPTGNGFTPLYTDGFNDLKALCPPNINALDFLGALYIKNNEIRLDSAACRMMLKDSVPYSVDNIISDTRANFERSADSGKSIIFYV
ncbi:MAG: hypothetical protein LUG85_01235 [Clostridiales bacterium]|nr:hypothetical protein [Clostridiales bacterium]